MVLDSGECVTSAIPVFDGYAIAAAAQQVCIYRLFADILIVQRGRELVDLSLIHI